MNILMLNKFDGGGGAARAALRLLDGLKDTDIKSRMLVEFKISDRDEVIDKGNFFTRSLRKLKYVDVFPIKLFSAQAFGNFSPAWLPDRVGQHVSSLNPDIVHLHWVGAGFLRLETLRKFNRPLIWTLHDSWAFTGGCHVPFECIKYMEMCGACPVLGSNREKDISRWVWKRKKLAWENLKLTIVTPSRWLADCAKSSSLFENFRVVNIPNGVDTTKFKPKDRYIAKQNLKLPEGKKIILFGGISSLEDKNKGFALLVSALQEIRDSGNKNALELVVFGSSGKLPHLLAGFNVHSFGRLDDDEKLVELYSAADVFVAPSILENLPNTIMEAMACGTPCVAFNQGGVPELIDHERTGYVARAYDPNDLAKGIQAVLGDDVQWLQMSIKSREKILNKFTIHQMTSRYSDLYKDVFVNNC